jgi:hypothetical protein
MNIIFGDSINELPDSFTTLELDTFNMVSEGKLATAYCVLDKEKLVTSDIDKLEAYKKVHTDLMHYYRQREWTYCEHAIEGLMGKWGGELDSFYTDLLMRVLDYKSNPPAEEWNGTRLKI